jgi:uncharacterized membrane protein YgdD (TMEM256/DUF423 family)
MQLTDTLWVRLAALSGLISVAAGAFGAHGVSDPVARELLRTGSTYAAIHALAAMAAVALARGADRPAHLAPALFLLGALLFSGSLYALAMGGPHIVGAITPLGGLAFMAGWAALALTATRRGDRASGGAGRHGNRSNGRLTAGDSFKE